MEPIKLSTKRSAPPTSPSSADSGKCARPLWFTIAGHKFTTHSVATIIGLILAAIGPYIAKEWPETAPAIDAARELLPKPDRDPAPSAPALGPYETKLRSAWAEEKDVGEGVKKNDKLARLIFLYRRTAADAETKTIDFAELSKSFHDSTDKLGMTGQLPGLRGVITSEWTIRIGKPTGPIDELTRVKISSFLRETLSILERLNGEAK